MAKTNKHAPGLYQKAKQQEAVKLAGGSPRNKRLAARAKRAAGDNEDDALSDDAISTDPWTTVINYGDNNIDCDGGNNEGDNDEEAENEDEGGNDEEAENEDEGGNDEEEGGEDGDNDQSGDENEQGNEDDSDNEDGDEDDHEGADEDFDDIDDEDYKGELYDDDESDDDSLEGGKYWVPSARGKGAGRKPHPDCPPKPNTNGMT
jgi:hypothetical protein